MTAMGINNNRDNDSTIILTFRFQCENEVPKNNNGKTKYKRCKNRVDVDMFPSDIVNVEDAAHYQKTRAKAIEKKFGQESIFCEQCLNSKQLNQNLDNIQGGNNDGKEMDAIKKRLPLPISHNTNCVWRG